MNRTFLIFLMIGTAMMIAVIGQHKSIITLDYTPWQVDTIENGSIRVFGMTLGKTTLQEANQIFASFADTQLRVTTSHDKAQQFELIAHYDELTMDGLVVQLQLTYALEQAPLKELFARISSERPQVIDNRPGKHLYTLNNDDEMAFLNTPIDSIIYIPSIDFSQDIIRQRFGQAAQEEIIDENQQFWHYPKLGLVIHLHKNRHDRFIYSSLK